MVNFFFRKRSLKITMGCWLIVIFSHTLLAQNASDIFENHHKWGVVGQFNTFEAADITATNNGNLSYDIFKSKRAAVGLAYNFYQKQRWNFRASLQLQWFGNEAGYTILEAENPTPVNIGAFYSTENEKLLFLPVTAEYVVFDGGKVVATLGAGLGLSYYAFDDVTFDVSLNDTPIFRSNYKNNSTPLYLSAHLEPSIYFKTKDLMFRLGFMYNKSFTAFRTGDYLFSNLEVSQDIAGSIDQSGDFFGLSLTLFLKKKPKK